MMTAMGQGKTMVSPLHMALITSSIANGGVLMKPYLVTEVQNYTGDSVKKYTPTAYGKLMTAEEASVLTDLMEAVVSRRNGIQAFRPELYRRRQNGNCGVFQ